MAGEQLLPAYGMHHSSNYTYTYLGVGQRSEAIAATAAQQGGVLRATMKGNTHDGVFLFTATAGRALATCWQRTMCSLRACCVLHYVAVQPCGMCSWARGAAAVLGPRLCFVPACQWSVCWPSSLSVLAMRCNTIAAMKPSVTAGDDKQSRAAEMHCRKRMATVLQHFAEGQLPCIACAAQPPPWSVLPHCHYVTLSHARSSWSAISPSHYTHVTLFPGIMYLAACKRVCQYPHTFYCMQVHSAIPLPCSWLRTQDNKLPRFMRSVETK